MSSVWASVTNSGGRTRGSAFSFAVVPDDLEAISQEYLEHKKLLLDTISTLLNNDVDTYRPISYEERYTAVYKCCVRHHSPKLFEDVCAHVRDIIQSWTDKSRVSNLLTPDQSSDLDLKAAFIVDSHRLLKRFLTAVQSIAPIFNYLTRFYVKPKLKRNFDEILIQIFSEEFLSVRTSALLECIKIVLRLQPLSVTPDVYQDVIKTLHSLDRAYAVDHAELFGQFIPGLSAPMRPEALLKAGENDRVFCQNLRTATSKVENNNFASGQNLQPGLTSRKRCSEEDNEEEYDEDCQTLWPSKVRFSGD